MVGVAVLRYFKNFQILRSFSFNVNPSLFGFNPIKPYKRITARADPILHLCDPYVFYEREELVVALTCSFLLKYIFVTLTQYFK